MSFLSGLAGLGKLATNFLGGGSGSTTNTSSNSTSKSNKTSTSNTQSNTSASRREFSDGMLKLLETLSANTLGVVGNTQGAVLDQTDRVQAAGLGAKPAMDFDPEAYVNGIVQDASARVNEDLNTNINKTVMNAGGSINGNSAAALLAGRLRNDAAANLAGVESNATASAAQIATGLREQQVNELASGTSQIAQLDTSAASQLATLLSNLKGGETYQTVGSNEVTNQKENATGTIKGSGSTVTPFNWTKGLGNIFADIDQNK